MSGYVRETDFEGNFLGQTVTAKLSQLSFGDFVRLKGADGDGGFSMLMSEILPKYVKNLTGLKAADGSDITLEEVCSTAYFIPLSTALGIKLMLAATPEDPSQPGVPSAA